MVHLFKLGKYVGKIIPTCAAIKIQEQFWEENGIYKNFEEDDNEEGYQKMLKHGDILVMLRKNDFYIFNEDIHNLQLHKGVIGIS